MTASDSPAEHPAVAAAGSTVVLLYDPAEAKIVHEKLVPLFGDRVVEPVACDVVSPLQQRRGSIVVTYLSDAQLAAVLPTAIDQEWTLGLLPHQAMPLAAKAFGVAPHWQDAADDIISAVQTVELDLLLCNERPVFDRVVIGDITPIADSEPNAGVFRRSRLVLRKLQNAYGVRLRPFTLKTGMDKTLDTAALGIIAVENGAQSVFTRGIVEDTHHVDGMLHAVILAPRAMTELIEFWFRSLLNRSSDRKMLPPFAGHIRTEELTVEVNTPVTYVRDGESAQEQTIRFKVLPQALSVLPGRKLAVQRAAPESKEIYRVKGLPVGEARNELTARPLPFRRHAATEEFRDLFQQLRESTSVTPTYLTLMVLSTLLATFGLFAGSGPVIIGAMILAPLMAPIISLSMGVLRQNEAFISGSVKTLLAGIAVAVGASAILTLFTPLHTVNEEISARLNPTLLDLGVAVLSGIAGAYAHARIEVARSLAGVAIAVALVPPLTTSGIGLGWADWTVFSGAFLLFLTNLAGIVLAASMTFLVLGYSPFHRAGRGLLLSLGLVLVVSVPLGFGFDRMVEEHRVIRSLDGWKVHGVTLRDVTVRTGDPLHVKATLVSERPVDQKRLQFVKRAIAARLGEPIVLEAVVAVVL